MNAYLDSSVILRKLLNEPDPLKEFSTIRHSYSSRIARIECNRTLDRMRLLERLDDEGLATLKKTLFSLFRQVEWIPLSEAVLQLAEGSFPTKVASLDAIHLSSAIVVRRKYSHEIVFTSHDGELLIAARSAGFEVLG